MSESASGVVWRDLWASTAAVVDDRQTARWLCETASASFGTDFLLTLEETPTERMVQHLDSMVARYRRGEPLQYVLGHWGFRRLDLAVDPRVLIPRPETEELVDLAREALGDRAPRRVADLGTGSGAIGLALASELPLLDTEVWLTDVDERALELARANLAGIGRAAANVRIVSGSWFDALPPGHRFDVIVSNPPYVAHGSPELDDVVARWEPHTALFGGADGLDHVRVLASGAADRMAEGGTLLVEIGSDQGDRVRTIFRREELEVEILPDAAGRDRFARARRY